MLVITRRSQEKIVFPNIGLTIQILKILGGNVRVGVDAPSELTVLRDELIKAEDRVDDYSGYSKKLKHELRNDLQQITTALHLYRELVQAGLTEEASDTFQSIMAGLKRVETNPILSNFIPRNVLKQVQALASATNESSEPIKVLLVEDNFEQRMVLAKLLRTQRFEVVELSDGTEVVEYFERHSAPRFLLIDMNMPICNGASALEKLRSKNRLDNTVVFAVSGHSPEEFGVKVGDKQDGVDQWFPKPIDPSVLIQQINSAA